MTRALTSCFANLSLFPPVESKLDHRKTNATRTKEEDEVILVPR